MNFDSTGCSLEISISLCSTSFQFLFRSENFITNLTNFVFLFINPNFALLMWICDSLIVCFKDVSTEGKWCLIVVCVKENSETRWNLIMKRLNEAFPSCSDGVCSSSFCSSGLEFKVGRKSFDESSIHLFSRKFVQLSSFLQGGFFPPPVPRNPATTSCYDHSPFFSFTQARDSQPKKFKVTPLFGVDLRSNQRKSFF